MSLKADRRECNDLAQEDAMWALHSDPDRRGSWTVAAPDRGTGTPVAPSMTYVAVRAQS